MADARDEDQPTALPEAWMALMAGLAVDYDLMKPAMPGASDARIAALLAIADDPAHPRHGRYAVANEIERRLAGHADAARLSAMSVVQLARAERIGVPGHAALADRIRAAEEAGDADRQRALVLALFDQVHRRFVDRRSERRCRSEVAMRLCQWGFLLLGGALLLLLVGFIYSRFPQHLPPGIAGPPGLAPTMFDVIGKWHVTALVWFGFFGAFFSRLIAFQTHAGAMTWDDLHKGYRHRVLIVRMMIGGFAAVIVYYMIAAGLLGGDLFPDLTAAVPAPFWRLGETTAQSGQALDFALPTPEFAKLVVWCFLAGFAERFLPDQLTALEARARTAS
ncbi:MAG: hypothetical protein KF887_14190 [Paracoccaceae bacterium]|nr:MAG: hypothetical protein KF887_14190 [Paracoccaceae bacterium]